MKVKTFISSDDGVINKWLKENNAIIKFISTCCNNHGVLITTIVWIEKEDWEIN